MVYNLGMKNVKITIVSALMFLILGLPLGVVKAQEVNDQDLLRTYLIQLIEKLQEEIGKRMIERNPEPSIEVVKTNVSDESLKQRIRKDVRVTAELYFADNSGSYSGLCDSGLEEETYSCNDTVTGYVLYAKLSSSYYCVDAEGFIGEVISLGDSEAITCSKDLTPGQLLLELEEKRSEARDTARKLNLNNARFSSEVHYNTFGAYEGVCSPETGYLPADLEYLCADFEEGYIFEVGLENGGYYCVDSSGYAEVKGFSSFSEEGSFSGNSPDCLVF